MIDAEYEAQKARIQALSDKWLTPLGLRGPWQVKTTYYREGLPDDMKKTSGSFVVAKTKVMWQYLDVEILWDLLLVEGMDDDELEFIYVHECMHALVNEMRWQDHTDADNLDHEERVATLLARAFVWTYDAGQESVKVVEPVSEPVTEAPKMNGKLDPATQSYLEATRMG